MYQQHQAPSTSHVTYSQQSVQPEYPYYPPYDNDVDFYESAVHRLDPQGASKKAKTCPICQFPVHILLISKPCQHYFCYECYQDNKIECGYCGSLNTEIMRANDYQEIWTCQSHCFKVFGTERELKHHLSSIQKLKDKNY